MKLNCCFTLVLLFILTSGINAQTKEIKEATVASFDDPYEVIIVNKEDIGDMSLLLDPNVVIKNKKGNTIKFSDLQEGHEITVKYEIRQTEEGSKKRIVTEIELLTEAEEGKIEFKGLFEGYEKDIAFIDGRRVRLEKDATFKGAKKGDGKINIDFIGFDDDLLKRGYSMKVKGKSQPDGVVTANEIIVRKNTATKQEQELIGLVNKGFNANGLNRIQAPSGIFNASNGLYNGNIAIGGANYKLSADIKLQGYINEVGYKLIPDYTNDPAWQKENEKIDFRFYVVDDAVPNAFAWPNGMVFIHTGLLKIIENEAQLSFVLAHEISHVLYEHGGARFAKSENIKEAVGIGKGLLNAGQSILNLPKIPSFPGKKKEPTIVPTVTTGNVGASYEYYVMMQKINGLGGTISNTTSKVSSGDQMLSVALNKAGEQISPDALSGLFAKDQESQADRVGLYYTQLAGYDIREVPKFWNKMMEKNNDPTFLNNIASGFKSLIKNSSLNLSGDVSSQLLNSFSEMIVNNVFKSVYSSHPLSQNRLKSTNQLLTTTYLKKDYSNAKVGGDEYKGYVAGLQ